MFVSKLIPLVCQDIDEKTFVEYRKNSFYNGSTSIEISWNRGKLWAHISFNAGSVVQNPILVFQVSKAFEYYFFAHIRACAPNVKYRLFYTPYEAVIRTRCAEIPNSSPRGSTTLCTALELETLHERVNCLEKILGKMRLFLPNFLRK